MTNYIGKRRYRTMTIEEAEQAAPLPVSGDPSPRYVVSRIRVMDIPAFESIGETPEGEPIFVPIDDCILHGICVCGCVSSREYSIN